MKVKSLENIQEISAEDQHKLLKAERELAGPWYAYNFTTEDMVTHEVKPWRGTTSNGRLQINPTYKTIEIGYVSDFSLDRTHLKEVLNQTFKALLAEEIEQARENFVHKTMQEMFNDERKKNKKSRIQSRRDIDENENNNKKVSFAVDTFDNYLQKNKSKLKEIEVQLMQESSEFEAVFVQQFEQFVDENMDAFIFKRHAHLEAKMNTEMLTYLENASPIWIVEHLNEVICDFSPIIIEAFEQENYDNTLFYSGTYNLVLMPNGEYQLISKMLNASSTSRYNQGIGEEVRLLQLQFDSEPKQVTQIANVVKKNKIVRVDWRKIEFTLPQQMPNHLPLVGVWLTQMNDKENNSANDGYSPFTGLITLTAQQHLSIDLVEHEKFDVFPVDPTKTQPQKILSTIFYAQGHYSFPFAGTNEYQISCHVERTTHLGLLAQRGLNLHVQQMNGRGEQMKLSFHVPEGNTPQRFFLNLKKVVNKAELQAVIDAKRVKYMTMHTQQSSSDSLSLPSSPTGSPPTSSHGLLSGISSPASQITCGVFKRSKTIGSLTDVAAGTIAQNNLKIPLSLTSSYDGNSKESFPTPKK